MEELFHLYLGLVKLLKDRFNVADGAVVGGLVVGNSGVPVARQRAGLKLSCEAGKGARTTHLWFCVLLRRKPKHKGLREGVCNTHLLHLPKFCSSWTQHRVWAGGWSFLVWWHCDLTRLGGAGEEMTHQCQWLSWGDWLATTFNATGSPAPAYTHIKLRDAIQPPGPLQVNFLHLPYYLQTNWIRIMSIWDQWLGMPWYPLDYVVQQWIHNTVQKNPSTPFQHSKRDSDLSFHWRSEMRCDCGRSDTAPVTFSIYRQQKGADPLTGGPGPRGNLLFLKEVLAWAQDSPDSSFSICAFMYINRFT